MPQNFIDCDREQAFLLPASLRTGCLRIISRGSCWRRSVGSITHGGVGEPPLAEESPLAVFFSAADRGVEAAGGVAAAAAARESKPLAALLMPSTAEYGPVSELLPPAIIPLVGGERLAGAEDQVVRAGLAARAASTICCSLPTARAL